MMETSMKLFGRGLFLLLFAVTACSGQGTTAIAPAVHGAPTYVPAALVHAKIPRAPSFAVPRAPDAALHATRSVDAAHLPFFTGEVALSNGVYYLSPPNDSYFGYYSYLSDSRYVYHFDAGYEYTFDAADGENGIYFYDFASQHYWYTTPAIFPYLYDFTLQSYVYYYPDGSNAGHYTSNPRYFYDFNASEILTM